MRPAFASCLAAAAAVFVATVATADTTPEDAVEYRQAFMSALRGHSGAVSMQVRGIAGDSEYLGGHVDALVALAAEMASVFPAGSTTADSEALPAIWERPEEFAKAIANFQAAVSGLADAAGGDDAAALDAAFREIGTTCKGCHESFRLKK